MADNFLERQYAAYEERKAAMKSGKKASASKTKFYTRPGKKVEKEQERKSRQVNASSFLLHI